MACVLDGLPVPVAGRHLTAFQGQLKACFVVMRHQFAQLPQTGPEVVLKWCKGTDILPLVRSEWVDVVKRAALFVCWLLLPVRPLPN